MTASCGIEGAKGVLDYAPFVRGAVEKSTWKPESILVWQREEKIWSPIDKGKRERDWRTLVQEARRRRIKADAVPVGSAEGLYIIYTSGECFMIIISLNMQTIKEVLSPRNA